MQRAQENILRSFFVGIEEEFTFFLIFLDKNNNFLISW